MLQTLKVEHLSFLNRKRNGYCLLPIPKTIFQTDCAESLIFKGGTSLSKGWGLIERFSEDIDLAISHSFFGVNKSNKSQRDKLRKLSRAYIQSTLSGQLDERLKAMGITGYQIENITHTENREGELVPIDSDKYPTVILLHYDSLLSLKIDYIPLYNTIIEHRQAYYAIRYVDYSLHHPDTINILPPENVQDDWRQDYFNMQRYFIYGRSLDFDHLMQRIQELQQRLRCM